MKNLRVTTDNILIKICSKPTSIELPDKIKQVMAGNIVEKIEIIAIGNQVNSCKVGDSVVLHYNALKTVHPVTKEIGEEEKDGIHYCMIKAFDVLIVLE